MIIKNIKICITGLFLFITGAISIAIKLGTTELVVMDDGAFLIPTTVALIIGIIGGALLSLSTESKTIEK